MLHATDLPPKILAGIRDGMADIERILQESGIIVQPYDTIAPRPALFAASNA